MAPFEPSARAAPRRRRLIGLALAALGAVVVAALVLIPSRREAEPPAASSQGAGPATAPGQGKPTADQLRARLTPEQFRVTQRGGTERPFQNEYWDHQEEGLYVDVVSGEPLFSSRDKFDSRTGWPSFSRPVGPSVVEKVDTAFLMVRTEVRSREADSHLGHVFDDGPPELGGRRYCINSAALRFVPARELTRQGYAEHAAGFAPPEAAQPSARTAESTTR